jgi:hypothetical protein
MAFHMPQQGRDCGEGEHFRVKVASYVYPVPVRHGLYVAARAYVSGCATWCCRLMEGMFPPCSLSCRAIQEAKPLARKSRRLVSRTKFVSSSDQRARVENPRTSGDPCDVYEHLLPHSNLVCPVCPAKIIGYPRWPQSVLEGPTPTVTCARVVRRHVSSEAEIQWCCCSCGAVVIEPL